MSKFVMTIFGASGDLTKRKLMPALYSLYVAKRLPEEFEILGWDVRFMKMRTIGLTFIMRWRNL